MLEIRATHLPTYVSRCRLSRIFSPHTVNESVFDIISVVLRIFSRNIEIEFSKRMIGTTRFFPELSLSLVSSLHIFKQSDQLRLRIQD